MFPKDVLLASEQSVQLGLDTEGMGKEQTDRRDSQFYQAESTQRHWEDKKKEHRQTKLQLAATVLYWDIPNALENWYSQ